MSCRKWEVQIFRWHAGLLDRESETALLNHLSTCLDCRNVADRSSEIDRLLTESSDPPAPEFLTERIIAHVIEEMRQDSWTRVSQHFIALFTHFRPAFAGIILVLGLGLGVYVGSNLSHFMNEGVSGSSYDVLALVGIERGQNDSPLDFIWTEAEGGAR